MTEQKKNSFRLLVGTLILVIPILIYINQKYIQDNPEQAEVAWKGSAFDWSERAIKDSTFVSALNNKYIELEGVLLNIVYSQGATTLYFTSGLQTDSCYLVGQQPDWKTLDTNKNLSSCDSLVLQYGKNYNLQANPVEVDFSGDVVNSDDDDLLNFSFFEDCKYTVSKRQEYRLHNFCKNKITVRAKLKAVEKEEKGISVELDKVLILSNEKNPLNMQP